MKPARPEDIPTATHSGKMKFGPLEINVHRLDDGRTIIEADDFKKIMEWMERGDSEDGDLQECETCDKSFPIEEMTMMEDCWICASCYAEWKKEFDACEHTFTTIQNSFGEPSNYCTKCHGLVLKD